MIALSHHMLLFVSCEALSFFSQARLKHYIDVKEESLRVWNILFSLCSIASILKPVSFSWRSGVCEARDRHIWESEALSLTCLGPVFPTFFSSLSKLSLSLSPPRPPPPPWYSHSTQPSLQPCFLGACPATTCKSKPVGALASQVLPSAGQILTHHLKPSKQNQSSIQQVLLSAYYVPSIHLGTLGIHK